MHLEVRSVTKRFGGLTAVADVSFTVGAGEVTALVGPNGAGKSTLLNVIAGEMAPTSGRILLGDRDLTGEPPHRVARSGVARTFQHSRLVAGLTVRENVLVAVRGQAIRLPGPGSRTAARRDGEVVDELLADLGLETIADRPAEGLAYGDMRRVEIARALSRSPHLLLLDEPAAGLNPAETTRLGELIQRVTTGRRIATLLVEHDLGLVRRVSARMVVLNFGALVGNGPPDEVCADPDVIAAYIGEGHDAA